MTDPKRQTISLVIPVFNEQDAVPVFYETVKRDLRIPDADVRMVFVNDGSRDSTSAVLASLFERDPESVTVINFSRNFGKEPALFAGIEHAQGDAVIPIDVDLQDPIEVIPRMVEKWREGYEVVLARRVNRDIDGWLKRCTAEQFYKLHNAIAHSKITENVGDFRLMDRTIVEAVKSLKERQLFMKGVLSWVGGRTAIVDYVRADRSTGETKFNGWKLWNLALEGITSFSTVPLRVWSYLGCLVAVISLVYAAWMVVDKLAFGNPVPGYPSLMTAILFLGGVQLIGIGVLGEYIGRIYMETKQRPRYLISSIHRSE
jgi:polyisoprenyl-phosphate glycosyltransferase